MGMPVDPPWDRLNLVSTPNRGEYRVIEEQCEPNGQTVLFALDSEGRRNLLIPVDSDRDIRPDRRSAGVHLAPQELEDAGAVGLYIGVSCRKRHLNEVFSHLAAEILQRLSVGEEDAYLTCRLVLSRWRELIDRDVPRVLSSEALAGLFGEVWWLYRLAQRTPGAVEIWTGPSGGVHDFRSGHLALEVKTTQSSTSSVFTINGLQQLEAPPGGELWLSTLRIEEGGEAGQSIPSVIREILATGIDSFVLTQRLLDAGYDMRDEVHYSAQRFRVVESRVFYVDESFPRLTRESFQQGGLPDRVVRLTYVLDLVGDPAATLSNRDVDALCNRLASQSA